MDRLRGPPVLSAGNKQQTDPVGFSDRISHKKGMTMNLKNKKGKRLTSTLMAVLMSVSTTLTPVNTMASEPETSSAAVESTLEETTAETQVQTVSETSVSKTQEQAASETAASEAQTSASEMQPVPETTEEAVCTEEVQTSGESAEETSANETRGPDETQENETTTESESETEEVTETETVEETSSEEPTIDLSTATKEDILYYIEAIGGDESDAFYTFIGSLGEYDYQLVWMAQYGAQEDQLLENFGLDYDAASDLDVAKYIHKLSEEELADFVESMTFEQYRRYISIKEMMAEMDEKDFSDVIDDEEFTADRTWDYASYDAFAESLTGVSLQRTEQTMQFYNTYVDPSKVQAGVTTIDGLLDSNADWYSNDYILSLNPEMFKETVPVYYGSDGNYYVVSTVPTLNGVESADYQPATNFYNDSVVAEAFVDIQYLGNGVYRIPSSRYQYCYTEQYVSDAGTLYGVSFGLRIQVLYGFTASGEVKISADVLYPDMTERFLPAVLNLASGTATVKIFNDDYDDTLDNYLVSASINRGESLPDGVSVINNGKTLQFVIGDNCAVGSLDVLIGYNATSKYSMAAQVTTESLYQSESLDNGIALTAQLQGSYLEMARSSVPSDLAVGDKFVYANTKLTITGVNNAADGSGTIHVGATTVPTHDAQEFCLYSPYDETALNTLNSWFKYSLSDANSASPGYLVQMTTENIQRRAASNGTSVNLGGQKIFGYLSEALGTSTSASGKTLNLEGTQVLLACMHAWHLEANTPAEVVNSVNSFTERTGEQETFAHDIGFGNYLPNIALQCTDVHDGGDGYTYATFKVVTSMLGVRGVNNPNNYQCAFATLNIRYEKQQEGYLRIHKSSANPEITNGNSCYSFDDINYGVFTDAGCVNNIAVLNLDANGYSEPLKLKAGTYYVREADATPGSGYKTNGEVYTVNVTAGTTSDAPVMCETTDVPLNDPLGIVINKINSDGTTAADLSCAEYTITYYPKQYISVAEIEADTDPDVKPTVWVIQTLKAANGNYRAMLDDAHIVPNSNSAGAVFGKNYTGNYIIPLGTITVEETKAPAGFTKDGAVVSSAKTGATISGTNNVYLFQLVDENSAVYLKSGNALSTSLDDETAVTLTYAERQINGSPKMEKHDFELNKKAAMGGTSFEGISFEIYCLDDSVVIGNDTYTKGQTITTVTSDAEGNIDVGMQFPVGHYAVREKAANNYYTMTTGQIHYFNVVEYQGGAFIQYEPDTNAVTFMDRVVRGDLSFVKKNSDTDEALAYIPFRITNNTTGETHYILTGADGTYTSAAGKTTNTNANDAVLSQYGDKDVIPQSVVDSLAKDAGLWFGMGSEGTMTNANDSYGSFVYGTYTITELKTEATRNMKMYTSTFTIDTDGKVLDLGTVNNVPMSIRTTLVDVNEEHFTEAAATVTLVDHVAYKNLDTDKTYTLTGTLYVKDGNALTELLTEAVDFQPTETNGTQDVTFTFDASALVGKSVVAFEELSLNGEFCAEHKDKNDENQTVVFPGLKTTARDSQTDDHVSNADDSITIIDTVEYSGLHVGNEYTITGTLMDQKTGKAVLDDDGNEITASKVITATESNGTVEIEFQFAGVSLAGKTIVVFENLDYEGKRYAVHADLNDESQTIYFPSIKTKATDKNTGLNQVKEDNNVTVVDTVTYTGLQPGKTYTMTGMLMSSAGNAIVSNGRRITASTEFTPTESDGSVDVVFNFDATNGFGGRQYVFFEYLYLDGVRVAAHTDISDTNQIIYIPSIRTTLIDSENGSHSSAADQDITLIDTVRYNGVEIGRTYTVTGTLVDKATGKEIVDDAGNKITASAEFTAEKTNGTIDVTFTFSGVSLAGKTVVAYEHMYTEGKEVAVHADLRDESQTEYFPSVHTTATSNDTEDHVVGANEKVTITDQVALKALKLGTEYTLSGTLMNAKTGKPIMVNGNTITARRTFTADAHEMTIPLTYTLNASELAGTTTVVFENLYSDGALLAAHADLEDAEQTVYIPEIHTTAKDQTTKINHTEAKPEATIIDTVSYSSLLPGKEYTMTGTLMNKKTGEPILIDGEPITASTTFTAEKSEGSVEVVFKFDASVLEGTTVVAFESLTYKGIEVAIHADIEDKDQTVYIPKVRTTAIGDDTKDHVTEAKKDVTIVDTVSYESLEVGREYTVKGILMDKATGKAILVDDKEVTAETTFVPETTDGTVDVTFVFDGFALEDTLLVAFETLYTEEKEVGIHAEIEDDAQTVYLPKIRTNAKDAITEIDHTEALPKAKVVDTVSYSSLLPGKEYTVTGTLMNKETKEPVLIDGEKVTASTTFTAEKSEGSVEVVFEFDASAIAGTTVVAFESMEYEGVEVAVHADIEDEDQTVYIPDVHTTATAANTTHDHVTGANEDLIITDEVVLTGLKIGNEYTVKGVLMDKSTGEELKVNDESITAEETFTADAADMIITLTYTLDATTLAGTTTVVFETLYTEGKEVGRHHEIDDEGQTVYIPEIHTTAADQKTGINHTEANEKATIVDTVYYSHLLPGKEYTVHGILMDKKTGESILIDGKEITASTTFTAENEEGSVDVIFTFDASILAPKTVVAFEYLEYEGIEIAVHEDIDDEDQTVYIPKIHTTAVGEDTQDHIEKAKNEAVIVDTVSYEGLEVGREYTVTGKLMDKETGEPILVNGEEVTAGETFTAETEDGSIDITFTFDSSALAGKSLVAFETLYTEKKEVAVHADIEDEGQTVRIPEIHTTATDKVTGDHDGVVAKETTVLDEVFYTNLIPGKEYTVSGKLMVKETGEPLTIDGKEVTAEKTFVAEEADGSIILEFTFDSSALAGKKIVAFEDVTYEGISIGTHEDLTDEDQTISYPEIHTTAADQASGSKTMTLGSSVTLVDTVTYKGLTAGKTYVVKGTIMDKASGEPIGVTAETTFTAEAADGSVEVTFTFDTTQLQGKTLVVFETLYDTQGNPIVAHSDLNDEDQTVSVPVQPVIPPVVTGDDSSPMPYVFGLAVAVLIAMAAVVILLRKRKNQK
ncbi:MAG: VaFE repeat-containing surface-anchored protein [Lachnospiraceae bacterium]